MKLLIRHSTRPPLKGSKDPDSVLLTKEGVTKAVDLGKSLRLPIRNCYSSNIPRCLQTLESILEGAQQKRDIKFNEILSLGMFEDQNLCREFIIENSLRYTIYRIYPEISKMDIPMGFIDIHTCASKILKLLFDEDDDDNFLDIYCTHDYQIAVLVTLLFNCDVTVDSIKEMWPEMLEGIYFSGQPTNLKCYYRNQCVNVDVKKICTHL